MPTTVIIVDDHAPFRRLARQMLEAEGFTVVGEAADGRRALIAVEALRPQVVLLDLQLPDLSGLEVARRIARGGGELPAVVLTSTRDGGDFSSLMRDSGARGFIHKTELSGLALRRLIG
jgi:DNA-binding NarL/FixJ family response regulator